VGCRWLPLRAGTSRNIPCLMHKERTQDDFDKHHEYAVKPLTTRWVEDGSEKARKLASGLDIIWFKWHSSPTETALPAADLNKVGHGGKWDGSIVGIARSSDRPVRQLLH
jgi:hypothetical protein